MPVPDHAPPDGGVVVGRHEGPGPVQRGEELGGLGNVAGDEQRDVGGGRAGTELRSRLLELGEVIGGPEPLAPAQERVERPVVERKGCAPVEECGPEGVDLAVQLDGGGEAGGVEGAASDPLQVGCECAELGVEEAALARAAVALGMEEGEGGLPPAAEVVGQRGELLDGVAGVREEGRVDRVGAAGGQEGEGVPHHRTDVGLDAAGLVAAGRSGRPPDLHGEEVEGREELLRVVHGQHGDGLPAVLAALLLDVPFAEHGVRAASSPGTGRDARGGCPRTGQGGGAPGRNPGTGTAGHGPGPGPVTDRGRGRARTGAGAGPPAGSWANPPAEGPAGQLRAAGTAIFRRGALRARACAGPVQDLPCAWHGPGTGERVRRVPWAEPAERSGR